jgi:hypothetical protein
MRVLSLHIHPVKSCRGLSVPTAEVVDRGLALDRRWMVVDERGHFVTQRELPALARVACRLEDEALVLSMHGASEMALPPALARGPRRKTWVWSFEGDAVVHRAGSAWFSAALGLPLELVYMPDDVKRPVNPVRAKPGDVVSFADGYPLLLVSQASVEDLNARLDEPIGVERFRPNVVIEGFPPFAEDAFGRLTIGEVVFRNVKPCDRCSIPQVDPATGKRGVEPARTLATYRKRDGKIYFGINLVHEGRGRIGVGDAVKLVD